MPRQDEGEQQEPKKTGNPNAVTDAADPLKKR
jgi:hypothetical protein